MNEVFEGRMRELEGRLKAAGMKVGENQPAGPGTSGPGGPTRTAASEAALMAGLSRRYGYHERLVADLSNPAAGREQLQAHLNRIRAADEDIARARESLLQAARPGFVDSGAAPAESYRGRRPGRRIFRD